MEDIADALLTYPEAGEELVAAAERRLVVNRDASHDGDDVLLQHLGKAYACLEQEFVPRVLHVMLVVGIVDDALEVALIVANFHLQLVGVFFHIS